MTDVTVDAPFTLDVAPSVEPGYELAPIEPMTAIEPIKPDDIVDGDWRVIDEPVTDIKEPFTLDELSPTRVQEGTPAQPIDTRTGAELFRNAGASRPANTQPAKRETAKPAVSRLPAPIAFSLPSFNLAWLDSFLGLLSFDWLFPSFGSSRRNYAAVDYAFYAVPSRLGADVHYYLINVCRLKVASESYDDEAEYRFSVPTYHTKRCEQALGEIAPKNWRRGPSGRGG